MIDLGIKETTATTGAGVITLLASSNFVRVSQSFAVGEMVSYCLTSGNGDKEWGIGSAGASNTLSRDRILATLVGTTYTRGGSAISLTGASELIVTETTGAVAGGYLGLRTPSDPARMYIPYVVTTAGISFGNYVANTIYYIPFQLRASSSPFTSMGTNVGTGVAAATLDMAIFSTVLVGNVPTPGPRIASASLDASTSGAKYATITDFHAKPGAIYWMACRASATLSCYTIPSSNQMNFFGSFEGFNQSWFLTSSGAMPSDASGASFTVVGSGVFPALYLRY